jgi:serine/threonine-protein kinase HipA
LFHTPEWGYSLCPAYDMVATALVVKGDEEELALTLNGKKRKLKRDDFTIAMDNFKIDDKVKNHMFRKFQDAQQSWFDFIKTSFLSNGMKKEYVELIKDRMDQLQLIKN